MSIDFSYEVDQLCEELTRLRKENEILRGALDLCMTGGNHLANYLIGACGPRFPEHYPVGSKHDDIRAAFGPGNGPDYEVWCCWDAIMRARGPIEEPASAGDEVEAEGRSAGLTQKTD